MFYFDQLIFSIFQASLKDTIMLKDTYINKSVDILKYLLIYQQLSVSVKKQRLMLQKFPLILK